jgi:hypothetical protein
MQENWWEQDQVVAPGGPRTIVVGPADPTRAATARRTNLQSAETEATLPYAARKAAAETAKAEADAAKADRERVAAEATTNPGLRAFEQQLQTGEVLQAIAAARKLIKEGHSTGWLGQMLKGVGGTNAANLKAQLNTVGSAAMLGKMLELKAASSQGASGLGSLSNREGDMLRDSIASLEQSQSGDQLMDSLDKVERHYRTMLAIYHDEDPRQKPVQEKYGIATGAPPAIGGGGSREQMDRSAPIEGPASDGLTFAQGSTRATTDPTLRGLNARVNQMFKSGVPDAKIVAYLKQAGVDPDSDPKLATSLASNFIFRRKNPNYRGDYRPNLESTAVPMSGARQALNEAAQSRVGSGVVGFADMISGGNLDSMTGNPELTRAGMAGLAQMNPGSTLTGQVIGGMALGAGGEALGAAAGIPRAFQVGRIGSLAPRAMAADAATGAYYGLGSSDEDRLGGAIGGGFGGIVGGIAGRRTAGALGRAATGVQSDAVQLLADRGVRMTPGQMLSQSGRGIVKGIEDRAAGFPIIGDFIKSQRREGLRDFNLAAFREGVDPVGGTATEVGTPGMIQAGGAVRQAYNDALNGVVIPADRQFATDLGNVTTQGAAIPGLGGTFQHIIQNDVAPLVRGQPNLTGETYQDILRVLRNRQNNFRTMASTGTNPLGDDVAGALGNVEQSLTDLVNRQSPETAPALQAANTAYRHKKVLERAVLSAASQPDQMFMPSQLNRASIGNNRMFGGTAAAAEGNRPFFDLGEAGQAVLPSSIPDSGTAGRWILPAGMAALGGGAGYAGDGGEGAGAGAAGGLGLAALLSAPYSRVGRSMLQQLLLNRPQLAVDAGNLIIRGAPRVPIGGALAPVTVPEALSYGPQ